MITQIINISIEESKTDIFKKYGIKEEKLNFLGNCIEVRNVSHSDLDELKCLAEATGIELFISTESQFNTNILIKKNIFELRKSLSSSASSFAVSILSSIDNFLNYNEINYRINNRELNFNRAYLMGILNVTPDSFSDGGRFRDSDSAAEYGLEMISNGADIIDVGGESTRPGSDSVGLNEEIDRVIPVIEKISKVNPDVIISVDTTKSKVADLAVQAGASIINDVSGLRLDPQMIDTAAKYNASVVIIHMKGTPKTMQTNPDYVNLIEEIYDFLNNQCIKAKNKGIKNIFIDPGIGFGKRIEHNFEIINRLEEFKSLGFPILTGVSRKSFLGKSFDLEIDQRDFISAITDAVAIKNAARIIRTHNVKFGLQVVKLLNHFIR